MDPTGTLSKQIDIILYDEQVTPPISLTEREAIVPCHAVVATVEVKSKLSREELRKAVRNARSVKRLHTDFSKLSPEAELRRAIDLEIIKTLEDSNQQDRLIRALSSVSSTACYIFAFESSMTLGGDRRKEYRRLKSIVNEFNANDEQISVPVSGLCIADRVFHYCVHADDPIRFKDVLADLERPSDGDKRFWGSHNVILKFISRLVDVANVYASQRWRTPLEVYFETSDETDTS